MKVLHVFDHSLPHHSGYAFRSECILRAQRELGIETAQLTGPKHVHEGGSTETIGELTFRRTPEVITGGGPVDQVRCVTTLRRSLKRAIAEEQPDVVHCHSPCLNGLAALGLGVPVVYEVRACWEDAAVSSGTTTEGSLRYRVSRALESVAARYADRLVVICDGLRDEFVSRGIPDHRIVRAGNAVDPTTLPAVDDAAVADYRETLGLDGRQVIGFFGSFYQYEGLELLMEALPGVIERTPSCVVLLAGGGESEAAIRAAVARLGLEDHVRLLGRIPHAEIGKCYGLADVMVFPRLSMKLTDSVTPLKPLEAMYLRTAVVASDVGGHRELVEHGETGLLFPAGDRQALTDALVEALTDAPLRERLVRRGREFVVEQRLWSLMAERYRSLYRDILDELADPAAHRVP